MGSDSGLSQFINTTDDSGTVPLANVNNPVNWHQLALSLLAGVVAAVSVGVQQTVLAVQRLIQEPIVGTSEFITALIDAVFNPITANLRAAWAISLAEFGILAFPVAVAMTLAAAWTMNQAINWIREKGVI